jgi:protein-S-isoprenylcysteine O-methyltransferase Ste14
MSSLNQQAFAGLAFLIVVLGAALFAPAGTLDYWQAWVFLAVFSSGVVAITIDLAKRDPALLARRTHAGPLAEKERRQKVIQGLASLVFVGGFVLCALDRHQGWSHVSMMIVIAGDALVAGGLFVVFRVFRANTFTSATIEVVPGQQVVSTGPYAVVRHPMYAGALVMMLGVPIALGSWWGLIVVPMMGLVIVSRLLDEEVHFAADLRGYEDYRAQVKRRLVPFVW